MQEALPKAVYQEFISSIEGGTPLNSATADVMATAIKSWAVARGVTHFSHQFHPLTSAVAEKHDAFLEPHLRGKIDVFSGKRLLFGETDGSSFPSGGLRKTHEARGYTTWDTAAAPYISSAQGDPVLIIPSVFYSWKGHALDRKIPLFRATEALKQETLKLFNAAGLRRHQTVHSNSGIEQEFFLLNKDKFLRRPDLHLCGRTLQGRHPAKGQELSDSYFGVMTPAALKCMHEMEEEAWKLGIPVTTRHREVCPNQYELAPMFAKMPLATDQNLMLMQVMETVAMRNNLACLFHEKPFAHVSGSGKHNNWSVSTNVSSSLFSPGDSPEANLEFLLSIAGVLRGVDLHSDLLRWCISGAGNDHRLGGHEAPPAIVSISMGTVLSSLIDSVAKGGAWVMPAGRKVNLGIPHLPQILADGSDRNRTSPFAFTENRFEVRSVGSSQHPAASSTVLSLILAESFRAMSQDIRAKVANGSSPTDASLAVVATLFKKHRRILFDGNGYSAEWVVEAKRRGLPNYQTTPDVLDAVSQSQKCRTLFESFGVLTGEEFDARNNIMYEMYGNKVAIEANVLANMSQRQILPAALCSHNTLGQAVGFSSSNGTSGQKTALGTLSALMSEAFDQTEELKNCSARMDGFQSLSERARFAAEETIPSMRRLRQSLDTIEGRVEKELWPFPDYESLLFERH